ncbi:MAG: putative lipid II flippase FtsW [Nitrospirota bacterium]
MYRLMHDKLTFHRRINLRGYHYDHIILMATLALIGIGLAAIYSSSAVMAMNKYGNPYYFLRNQLMWVAIGLLGMFIGMRLNYTKLKGTTVFLLILSLILLILVLIPGIGSEINGARRWLRAWSFSFQPIEIAKLSLIIYIAYYIERKEDVIRDFKYGFLPAIVVLTIFQILIMRQPDIGSAFVIGLCIIVLLFIAGARITHILTLALISLPYIYKILSSTGYRKKRIIAFLDPWNDSTGAGFQMVQSFLALGSGGLFGVGIGEGKQKLFYLPEPHTDFIFSLIGEELGFVGGITVILLFSLIIWRGLKIALGASDVFGMYLALGITIMIGGQALMNLGVVTGLLPTKGITLPFVSAGGSSLVVSMTAIGILLSVRRVALQKIQRFSCDQKGTAQW